MDTILRFAPCVKKLAISVNIVHTVPKLLHQTLKKSKLIKKVNLKLKLKKFLQKKKSNKEKEKKSKVKIIDPSGKTKERNFNSKFQRPLL